MHEVVELVDQDEYIHGAFGVYRANSSASAFARTGAFGAARLGLGLGLGSRGALTRGGGSEDPAPAARAQLLEELLGLAPREDDLVALGQLRFQPVDRVAASSPHAQLLHYLLRVVAGEPHLAVRVEQPLEPVGVAHSCGFSGVPGRPAGNSSLNLRATASGTSPSTFPPNDAISFTPLDDTKLNCGRAMT